MKYFIRIILKISLKKKNTSLIIGFISISYFFLLLASTFSNSIQTYIDEYVLESLPYRTMDIIVGEERENEVSEFFRELTETGYVEEFYQEYYGLSCILQETSQFNIPEEHRSDPSLGNVLLSGYQSSMDMYIIDGRGIQDGEINVGVIPEDFMPVGSYGVDVWDENKFYLNGKDYIGKELSVKYDIIEVKEGKISIIDTYEYTFTVVGTYNSYPILYEADMILVPRMELNEMVIRVEEESKGLTGESIAVYSVIGKKQEYMKVFEEIAFDYGFTYAPRAQFGDILMILPSITLFARIFSVLFVVLGGLIIFSIQGRNIRQQCKEYGAMKAIGYGNVRLCMITFGENMIHGLIGWIVSIVLSVIAIFLIYVTVVQKLSPYEYGLNIYPEYKQLFYNGILVIAYSVLSSFTTYFTFRDIHPSMAIQGKVYLENA